MRSKDKHVDASMIVDGHRLQTPSEVARELRSSPRTIRRWIALGLLPAVRVRRRLLIPTEAIEALLTGRSREPGALVAIDHDERGQ